MSNENFHKAKNAKNDEFYTRYADIQKEINAYIEYNSDVFRDKTILLPCDDPEWSNFTKFFCLNFDRFGLKKLISTSYAFDSKKLSAPYQASMFEEMSPQYEKSLSASRGKIFTLERGERKPSPESLVWRYLDGDGDFRSKEVTALRDEADIIVTNPPFSLFREFLAWIMSGGKKFLIIGNKGSVTYKNVFPLIKENRMWSGAREWKGGMWFESRSTGIYDEIIADIPMKNVPACWFTNLEHGRRHRPLKLMSAADNMKFNKHKEIRENEYVKFDDYNAINIPYTDAIPSDYDGVMGVPISFLDKYCPEQFEIADLPGTAIHGMIESMEGKIGGKITYARILIRYAPSWISSHPEDFGCV